MGTTKKRPKFDWERVKNEDKVNKLRPHHTDRILANSDECWGNEKRDHAACPLYLGLYKICRCTCHTESGPDFLLAITQEKVNDNDK